MFRWICVIFILLCRNVESRAKYYNNIRVLWYEMRMYHYFWKIKSILHIRQITVDTLQQNSFVTRNRPVAVFIFSDTIILIFCPKSRYNVSRRKLYRLRTRGNMGLVSRKLLRCWKNVTKNVVCWSHYNNIIWY